MIPGLQTGKTVDGKWDYSAGSIVQKMPVKSNKNYINTLEMSNQKKEQDKEDMEKRHKKSI